MPERELRAGAGGQDPVVEAEHPVLGAAGVHTVRGPVERHARPSAPAAHVHTDRGTAADGRVQRAQRVQLALVACRGRRVRVPGSRAHRVAHLLRGGRRVLRGRHHARRGPHQAHRPAHVAVLHRHADRRVHRRLPQRQHRLLRHVRRVHSDELPGAGVRRRAHQGHVRAVREGVHLADGQPQGDRRLDTRAGQETAQSQAARLHDHRVAAHHRAHARYGIVVVVLDGYHVRRDKSDFCAILKRIPSIVGYFNNENQVRTVCLVIYALKLFASNSVHHCLRQYYPYHCFQSFFYLTRLTSLL